MSGRLIEIDGEYYRMRRGRLVRIPNKWAFKVTTKQTINRRQSKHVRKLRMDNDFVKRGGHPRTKAPRHCKLHRTVDRYEDQE